MNKPADTLAVATPSDLKKELFPQKDFALQVKTDQEITTKAEQFVDQLLNFDVKDVDQKSDRKASVEQMGLEVQKRAAKKSELLRQPVSKLATRAEDGGDVANALINLKMKVEELDPGKFDLEAGWVSRTLGRIPGVGTPIKRYFSKFESAQTVIASIIRSLEDGRDQLHRDNVTLTEDQKEMQEAINKLERAVALGQMMDQKIQYKLDREITAEDPRHRFIQEELMFPLRQRIIDLQQQLAVSQQGYLAIELIMRNNKELIRGVNRSLSVTVSALETAATVAMALANQKIVLDKIQAVSKTTSDLISGTAQRLKTQGAEIHKQAASGMLDMNALKSSFSDLKAAMDDVANFRVNALPQMAQSILELNQMSSEAQKAIAKVDEAKRKTPEIKVDLE